MLTKEEVAVLDRIKVLKSRIDAHQIVMQMYLQEVYEAGLEMEALVAANPDIEKKEYPEWLQALMS